MCHFCKVPLFSKALNDAFSAGCHFCGGVTDGAVFCFFYSQLCA